LSPWDSNGIIGMDYLFFNFREAGIGVFPQEGRISDKGIWLWMCYSAAP